jgi:predicted nicotinamide N-methyase
MGDAPGQTGYHRSMTLQPSPKLDPRGFILANTRLQYPPHAPEVRLHLADEITPIWRLTEEELGELGLPPPFWAFAWAGGQAVARYLFDYPMEARGYTVLDFATGSGMVAIAAMLCGARSAVGADIDPYCQHAVALNAEANRVQVGYIGHDLLDAPPPEVEVITAGDIAYEGPLALKVRQWLQQAHAQGTRVLIGDPGRTYFSTEGLVQLEEYRVETTRELEDMEIKKTGVWTFAG